MKITRIKIQNFKSFRDSPWIELSSGFTVIVGQNNSGKTALLQSLRFGENPNVPHKGPTEGPLPLGSSSTFYVDLSIDGKTIENWMIQSGSAIYIPIPNDVNSNYFVKTLFEIPVIELSLICKSGQSFQSRTIPSHALFESDKPHTNRHVHFERDKGRFLVNTSSSGNDNIVSVIDHLKNKLIYVFDPERLKIGSCDAHETDILDVSARNLPAVLATMHRNPAKWEIFNGHVRDVFSSVRAVQVSTLGEKIAVYIWQNDPATSPDDHAILLQESGTGLAQVLSILYVAMTRYGNVIAIDEPNSFLHPGAAKKLMVILKHYNQNQYVISTHSPELISVIDPQKLILVTWKGGESLIEQLDRRSIDHLQTILEEVGCELADVFAAERVVWCEGPTEAKCFPLLARAADVDIATTAFLKLRATGDLTAKKINAQTVMDIYGILSTGPALIPRKTAFNLDREGRSNKEIEDIVRQSRGRAKFLPARTYENFLLDADAISAVLVADYARDETQEAPPSSDQVGEWLAQNGSAYTATGNDADLDAPKLLNDLFQTLTNELYVYGKIHHSVELTKWLLSNKPEKLAGLIEYVRALVADEPT